MKRRLVWLVGGLAPWALLTACSDSPFGEFGRTIDARITSGDTTVFKGTITTFFAVAQYDIGPGDPQTVAWEVSDNTKIRLDVVSGDAHVTGIDTGQANLIAHINGDFFDTVAVTVVQSGMVRWRRSLPALPGMHPALDDSGRVHVVDLNGNLWAFGPTGDTLVNVSSCSSSFGPAFSTLDRSITTSGTDCTRQHDRAGIIQWTATIGDFDTAPALASDGATMVLSLERDQGAGVVAVVLTRLSLQGSPLWRDTLVASSDENAAKSAPSIASNGDIYVTWRTKAGSYHLTRFTGAGSRRWTIDLPNWARLTSPAMGGTDVAVGYHGGMAVYDTANGGEAWSVTFSSPATHVSSPIIDRDGNVYVQTTEGLFAYASDGTERWAADSLGAASSAVSYGVGAPTLLVNDDLVVHCGGAVCGVESTDGSLQWRAPVSNVVGSAVIDLNGEIYVTTVANEVIALWGNILPGFNGWPTEGADQQRSRRRL